jgi:hypothetical protein
MSIGKSGRNLSSTVALIVPESGPADSKSCGFQAGVSFVKTGVFCVS